jgi:predicted acyltransferase
MLTLVPFGGMPPPDVATHDRNLAGFIDAAVFGSHTLMPGFDPEGLLGTLPTIATALLGALAGQWLRRHRDRWRQIAGLSVAGVLLAAGGLVWSVAWPVNKPLWTGSYALLMSGLAAITLAVAIWLMDVMDIRGWAKPFLALGVNPLAIYFGSEFVGHLLEQNKHVIYWGVFARFSDGGPIFSLLFAVAYVACWLAVAVILDRRHIRIRV